MFSTILFASFSSFVLRSPRLVDKRRSQTRRSRVYTTTGVYSSFKEVRTREYASVYVRIQTRTTLGSPFLHFLSSFQRAHLHSRFRKERTNHISRTPRIAARKNQNWNGRPSLSVSFSFFVSLLYHQLRLVSAAANE